MSITFSGLEAVLTDIDMRLAAAKQVVTDDLTWMGAGAKEEMIRTHTFQNRTFRLEGSIDFDVTLWAVSVFALTGYASEVEFGVPGRSRPYPFFWPVWYTWLAMLEERLKDDWPRALGGG